MCSNLNQDCCEPMWHHNKRTSEAFKALLNETSNAKINICPSHTSKQLHTEVYHQRLRHVCLASVGLGMFGKLTRRHADTSGFLDPSELKPHW